MFVIGCHLSRKWLAYMFRVTGAILTGSTASSQLRRDQTRNQNKLYEQAQGLAVVHGDSAHSGLDLGPEGVGVALQDALDRRLPRRLVLVVVAAVDAVAAVAVTPRRKALAVPARDMVFELRQACQLADLCATS